MRRMPLVILAAFLTCLSADAFADRYVDLSNLSPVSPYDTWAKASTTIQDAVNAASDYETIWVRPGRYALPTNHVMAAGTNVVYLDKPLDLRSTAGAEETIIDGQGLYRCLALDYNDNTMANLTEGFTFTGGAATNGAGINYIVDGSSPWDYMNRNWYSCVFSNNHASGSGGGFYAAPTRYGLETVISNCVFQNNSAGGNGGGLLKNVWEEWWIYDSLFEGNRASGDGGAINTGGRETTLIQNCIFRDNRASSEGGAMYGAYLQPTLVRNSLFVTNYASFGAVFNGNKKPQVFFQNCTMVSNRVSAVDRGMIRVTSSDPAAQKIEMYNCILYHNINGGADTDLITAGNYNLVFSNNCFASTNRIDDFYTHGNITNAPVFVDFAATNLRHSAGSPCVDAGVNQSWMTGALDLDGSARIQAGSVDIGCYEYADTTAEWVPDYCVARNGQTPSYPYADWNSAASNIQDAVDAASDGAVIGVAPGTYTVSPNAGAGYLGHTNIVTIEDLGLTLRSSSGDPADTIIDGEGRWRGIYPYPGSGERIVIDGITISNCWAPRGAGLLIRSENTRTVVVQNCSIQYNTACTYGGGVMVWQPSDKTRSFAYAFSNCVFQANLVTNGTGGALIDSCRKGGGKRERIVDCEVIGNVATNGGLNGTGGFYLPYLTDGLIDNCVFTENRSGMGSDPGRAGAIYTSGNLTLRNCLIYNNRGDWAAGVYIKKNGDTVIENCTIADNNGNGVRAQEPENDIWFYNTIVYNNGIFERGAQVITNCCFDPSIAQWTNGVNTFTSDPQFVNAENGNYRLASGSPCVDAGMNQSWMTGARDLGGSARIQAGTVDIGCYEGMSTGVVATAVNNGNGASDVTDTSARLNGVLSADTSAGVRIYWGATDGGENATAWDNVIDLGTTPAGAFAAQVTELDPGTTYHYRCYATDQHGAYWAADSTSFTTVEWIVSVDNGDGATDVTDTSATLNGVLSANANAGARIYWGATDGGDNAAAWDNVIDLGTTPAGAFAAQVTDLDPGTTYHYRCYATDQHGAYWAADSTSFTTVEWIVSADNGDGATDVTDTSATLNGVLSTSGGAVAGVLIYYGATDGGVNAAAWDNVIDLGTTAAGAFAAQVTELDPGTTYQYRCCATNRYGASWAADSASFTTVAWIVSVDNGDGASDVTDTGATLNGVLSTSGGAVAGVLIYYGATDGGENAAAWDNVIDLGTTQAGAFSVQVTELDPGTTYHYRSCATNQYGASWATDSASVTTIEWVPDHCVARNGQTPSYPYADWSSAASNIQDAVDAASDGAVIGVAPGTYTVSPNAGAGYLGHTNIVTIEDLGLTLRGSSGDPADTIIDGEGRWRGIYTYPGLGDRITIDGITISNCYAGRGAGLFAISANTRTVLVQNCDIKCNTARDYGGGAMIREPNSKARSFNYTFSNCVFQGNVVTNGPGGALVDSCRKGGGKQERIVDCEIIGNGCTNANWSAAAGFYLPYLTDGLIENCVFTDNRTGMGGPERAGAIFTSGDLTLRNCLIYNNRGDWAGGVYIKKNANTVFENCTITDNEGNGVRCQEPENDVWFYNTIIYNDGLPTRGSQVITNCCFDPSISQWTNGVNTFTSDPQFVNAENGNYRLASGSPCVDAGMNQSWMTGARDLDGSARIQAGTVDIGCYEGTSTGVVETAVDNGTGASGVTETSAWLNGVLSTNGSDSAGVLIYWGATDGGENAAAWDNVIDLGTTAAGPFTAQVTELDPGTTYRYRCCATNQHGVYWAENSANFTAVEWIVSVDNGDGASGVTDTGATLNGVLSTSGGAVAGVRIYWGATDGGENVAAWDNVIDLGTTPAGTFTAQVSNLDPGTTYYYRCYATDQHGAYWAADSANFTTVEWIVSVNNGDGATGVTDTDATLNGVLSTSGSAVAGVRIYWGTTDGGENAAAWDNVIDLGTTPAGTFTAQVSNLDPGTTYYYRCCATNQYGANWAADSASFATVAWFVSVDNGEGASDVTDTSATLNGVLSTSGGAVAGVRIYWGATDGGVNAAAWDNVIDLGTTAAGAFSVQVTNLDPGTTYHYRCCAIHRSDTSWAASSTSFTPLNWIVKAGETGARAEIVISTNSARPRMTALAALELQYYVNEISGVRLPIVTNPTAGVAVQVYVGQSDHTAALGVTDEGLEHGAFRMVSGPDWVVLLGHDTDFTPQEPYARKSNDRPRAEAEWDALTTNLTEGAWASPFISTFKAWWNPSDYDSQMAARYGEDTRWVWDPGNLAWSRDYQGAGMTGGIWMSDEGGTLNAVYAFLDDLGARWYMPLELGEILPTTNAIALPVGNNLEIADYQARSVGWYRYSSFDFVDIMWTRRLGMNYVSGGQHGLTAVHRRDEMKVAHPEYYAVIGGVLQTNGQGTACFSSTGLVQEAVNHASFRFDQYDHKQISVWPADGFKYCECESCANKTASERVFPFANEVAEKLLDRGYSNRLVLCGAYTPYKLAPTNVAQFSSNLVVVITNPGRPTLIETNNWTAFLSKIDGWDERLAPGRILRLDNTRFSLWNWPNPKKFPVIFPRGTARELKALKGISIGDAAGEASQHGGKWYHPAINHLNYYVQGKFLWDADQDVDELLDEYYATFYGPAADEMKAAIEYVENNLNSNIGQDVNSVSATKSIALNALLRDAYAAAGGNTNTVYGQRINLLMSEIKFFNEGRYVDCTNPNPVYPYTNGWDSAATNIQDAINAALPNETIWVAPGVYTLSTNRVVYGGTNVVCVNKPLTLKGIGGPGETVIDGEGDNRCLLVQYGHGDYNASCTTLDGFTLRNGVAAQGGAIWYTGTNEQQTAQNMQARLLNCVLTNNVATNGHGGAIYAHHSSPVRPLTLAMSNCLVRGNSTLNGNGGGVCWRTFGPATVTDSLFEENAANGSGVRGGGLSIPQNSTAITIDRTIFRRNTLTSSTGGDYGGGGAYFRICTVTMRNSLFVDNYSNRKGGAVYFYYKPKLTMENCTIASNRCESTGSAAIDLGGKTSTADLVRFNNNIIYNNVRGATTANVYLHSWLDSRTYATNNCTTPSTVWTSFIANGNITNEPAFVDLANLDLHLSSNSPCLNTGTNLAWMTDAIDIEGYDRIEYAIVDRGCFEAHPDIGEGDELDGPRGGNQFLSTPSEGSVPFSPGADDDEDGIANIWEYTYFGSPTSADPSADGDGDGWSNWEEYIADTDPTVKASRFAPRFEVDPSSSTWRMVVDASSPGRLYEALCSTNLMQGWSPAGNEARGNGARLTVVYTNGTPHRCFFWGIGRVRMPE